MNSAAAFKCDVCGFESMQLDNLTTVVLGGEWRQYVHIRGVYTGDKIFFCHEFNTLQKLTNHKRSRVVFLAHHQNYSITNVQWQNRFLE